MMNKLLCFFGWHKYFGLFWTMFLRPSVKVYIESCKHCGAVKNAKTDN